MLGTCSSLRSARYAARARGPYLCTGIADASGWRGLPTDVVGWSQNRDPAVGIQCKQVSIAGHDDMRTPVDGDVKKLVVLRITRRQNGFYDFHHLKERQQAEHQCVALFVRDVGIEFR